MPAPTSPEEAARRRKAIAAAKASGVKNPYTIAAEALGMSRNTLPNWDRNYTPQDEAIKAAKTAVRTALSPALVWAKTKPDEDGNSFSVLLKPQATEGPDLVEMMAEAFADIPVAPGHAIGDVPSRGRSGAAELRPGDALRSSLNA